MSIAAIISIITAVIGVAVSVGTAVTNAQSVEKTNETNLQMTREANQSNVEQANLAYQRSLPINQVNNLISAGMSKQGALNSLTGGGSYTAPTLQAGHADAPQMDLSGIQSALQRIDNIPSNVEQQQLVEANRRAIEVDTQNKIYENQRQQEQHDFNMWKLQYDKDVAISLDNASSKVASALLDSGKTIEDFKDFETMIRELGLSEDSDIRNLPASAREKLEQSARNKFQIEYDRQAQENANREQVNNNRRANEDVQNARQGRRLAREEQNNRNREQRNRNQEQRNRNKAASDSHDINLANLKKMRLEYDDAVKENRIKDKERLARSAQAELQKTIADAGLTLEELRNSLVFNSDGTVAPEKHVSETFKYWWSLVGDSLGIGYVSDILRAIFNK